MRITYFITYVLCLQLITSCGEDRRFEISDNDSTPPSPPEITGFKPIVGGARIYYKAPADRDILSINAEVFSSNGKKNVFSASYFTDSLDVLGFADTDERLIHLYALDRAGNRSADVPLAVYASESALEQVSKTIKVVPSFNSFQVIWENKLQQTVNIYVDMVFKKSDQERKVTWVLSGKDVNVMQTIDDIILANGESLHVNIRVGDPYGNISPSIEMGDVPVMNDHILTKELWKLPNAGDLIDGVPMCFGNAYEAKAQNVINGIISLGSVMDIMHTGGRGRTGNPADGNSPWNFIIDLGAYYEISRIVTNQRHDINAVPSSPNVRGLYYSAGNVNRYNMYFLDETTGKWEFISQHTIQVPIGISELEIAKMGAKGDMALMYPAKPAFTKPARWFRYEAVAAFSGEPIVLSEITLYGKKANQ